MGEVIKVIDTNMKASDYYKSKDIAFEYEKKYLNGKNRIEDCFEDCLIHWFFKRFGKANCDLLEIGFFTGRVARKIRSISGLEQFSHSDIHPEPLNYSELRGGDYYQITLGEEHNNCDKRFDRVISIGHQLSFSGNIRQSMRTIHKLAQDEAVLLVDVWNSIYEGRPNYLIDTITRDHFSRLASETGFDVLEVIAGPSLYHLVPVKYQHFLNQAIKCEWFVRFYSRLEFFLRFFPRVKSQTIYFVLRRR